MKSKVLKVVLAGTLAVASSTLAWNQKSLAAAAFKETFEQGNASSWSTQYGTWSVVSAGEGHAYKQSALDKEARAYAGENSWSDYRVDGDVTVLDFNGSNRAMLAGRYKDGNNYYAASLTGGKKLELRKKVNGSSTTLASKDFISQENHTYRISLIFSGSKIAVYVDGALQLSATDNDLTNGSVGLIGYKTAVQFDNIIVTEGGSGDSGPIITEPAPEPTPGPASEPIPTPAPEPTPNPSEPGSGQNPAPQPENPTYSQSSYSVTGFANGVTGGGVIAENASTYRKVYTAADLASALKKGSGVKVIEIMNDLNLGWNEIPEAAKTAPFAKHSNAPLTHPVLLKTGVTNISVDGFDGLTIFSANGSKIKHATITIKRSSNLVIRNLEFDELWEWDEATKGNYDRNDWDYLTIENSHKVWIDHSTFHKAYDGLVDVKKGSTGVTISWSKFLGDDQSSTGWVAQQINAMESSRTKYPMYDYLRSIGLSTTDIIAIASGQKKGHLIGATEFASDNVDLQVTLHHNYYQNIQDRMPRLRGGNVHAYNIVMDASGTLAAKQRLTSKIQSAISSKGYHFGITSNGAISTEGGAVLVEGSQIIDVLSPVRNNQVSAGRSEYTGKIQVVDTIYTLNGQTFRGGSDMTGSPLNPEPAAVKPFAWNGFNKLPYSYTVEDPTGLKEKLSSASGAGVLNWDKTQWLKTVE